MRQRVTDEEEGVAGRGIALAALAVAAVAVLLMALPAVVALRLAPGDGAAFAALAASLAGVVGGAKFVAVLWGLGARFVASLEPRAVAADIE